MESTFAASAAASASASAPEARFARFLAVATKPFKSSKSIALILIIPFCAIMAFVSWVIDMVLGRTGQMKRTLILGWAVALFSFSRVYETMPEVSAFAAGPLLAIAGITLLYAVARYGHTKLDLINELKRGNLAPAVYFLGYAFIIGVGVAVAMLAAVL